MCTPLIIDLLFLKIRNASLYRANDLYFARVHYFSKSFHTMKLLWGIVLLCGLLWPCAGFAQPGTHRFYQLYQLDSISRSQGIEKHFGDLYFESLFLIDQNLTHADTTVQRLVGRLEKVFADYYIEACASYCGERKIDYPVWQTYFLDTTLSPLQYKLLGANAHINGDLANAITRSFTADEWKLVKQNDSLIINSLSRTYLDLYEDARHNSRQVRLVGKIALGLDKQIGNYLLIKWRRRQMRLAELYFASSPRYEKLRKKTEKKKSRIDRLVINQVR